MAQNFIIENGVLKEYTGKGPVAIIPANVSSIGDEAFKDCKSLKTVVIPSNVKSIGKMAFESCESLSFMRISGDSLCIGKNCFGSSSIPKGLIKYVESLWNHMDNDAIVQYIFADEVWNAISAETHAEIFINRQGKTLTNRYKDLLNEDDLICLGNRIIEIIKERGTGKQCELAYNFMEMFSSKLPDSLLVDIYSAIKSKKQGDQVAILIEKSPRLASRIKNHIDNNLETAEKIVEFKHRQSLNEIEKSLKKTYGISISDMPTIRDKDHKEVSPIVLGWLLVEGSKKKVEIPAEVKTVIEKIDYNSLMAALLALANRLITKTWRSEQKRDLAFPICKYTDGKYIKEIINSSKKKRALQIFEEAILYNNSKEAMMAADQMGKLRDYARLRGMDEHTFRDLHLSNIGLDQDGTKTYQLGNQKVVVRMQKDFSFIVELPESGKTMASLPKKGVDEEEYENAKKDFSGIKKSVREVVKNRKETLFRDFLEKKGRSGDGWKSAYKKNPVLRNIAALFVWSQNEKLFTMTDCEIVDVNGKPYTPDNKKIFLAHPMEMKAAEVSAWQNYFVRNGLKQLFPQIWEPVRNKEEIQKERYVGIEIPAYQFINQDRHGIEIDYDPEGVGIGFDECSVIIGRPGFRPGNVRAIGHYLHPQEALEIERFEFDEYTRKVNHIVAYLDRITVFERVKRDDITIADIIKGFTLAQILECINIANESKSTNCMAILLEEKNTRWPEYGGVESLLLE